MFSTRKNVSKLMTLALAIVAAAVFTTSASAMFDGSQSDLGVSQQNATSGGDVTPTDLARAVPRESNAPVGVTPTDLARSVPQVSDVSRADVSPQPFKAPPVSKSDTNWNLSVADSDLALGFGLGLALAIIFSLALVTSRNRIRIAHS
jgi:hypothetical protein